MEGRTAVICLQKKYKLIYADPPWQFNDTLGHQNRKSWYNKMSVEDICKLSIHRIAADDCLLAMWWVGAQAREAIRVAEAWGFDLITMKDFTYHKKTKNGKDFFGLGRWTRQNTEDCLFARKGKPVVIDHGVRQFISCEYLGQSVKPDEARTRLIQLLGDIPRIELFSRHYTEGWDVWGNEVESDIVLC